MLEKLRRSVILIYIVSWSALIQVSPALAQDPTPTRGPSAAALERGSSNLDIILGASVLVIIIVSGVLINARYKKKD